LKKTLKKLSKIILILTLVITMNLSLIITGVQANNSRIERVYEIDYCEKVLKYKGIARGAVYVVYEEGGKQFPAYCINPEKLGVGDNTDAYNVNVNNYITDVTLWRIITNGYPYKTLAQLGVANEKEAYLATKQAIYCYLENRNVNEYSGIGEAGARTLNALKQIWNNAMSSNETKISNEVKIEKVSSLWTQDKLNSNYVSKTYKVQAPAPITNYTIQINGENLPTGLIVTDVNNKAKNTFNQNEEFKILIPVDKLTKDGNFEISVKTQMLTKPVLFGVSENQELQNYALTAFSYEDSFGVFYEQYLENDAKIEILKQEKDTKKPLKGVEFQLLNSEKKLILQSLISDENGKIILENIIPGTYYLKEVKTLPGYVLYDDYIKIDISLNEQVKVIVNNSREKNIEVSKEQTNIEVTGGKNNTEISKDQTNIEVTDSQKNTEVSDLKTNVNIEISENTINKTISETNINIKKLPKTGM